MKDRGHKPANRPGVLAPRHVRAHRAGRGIVSPSRGERERLAAAPGPVATQREVETWDGWRSDDVWPQLSLHNLSRVPFADAVLFPETVAPDETGSVVGSNGPHNVISKFGAWVSFADRIGPVSDPVICVRFFRVPSEIGQRVVCPAPVVVAAFHSLGAWAYEGLQDEAMNEMKFPVTEYDSHISGFGIAAGFHQSPSRANASLASSTFPPADVFPTRPQGAVVADAIAGEAGAVLVNDRRISRSHDVTSYPGCVVVRAGER